MALSDCENCWETPCGCDRVDEEELTGLNALLYCKCETKYSIEKHGDNQVLYLGRCGHKHGENLFTISDVAFNCDLESIVNKLNS
jgi:hypothetical protein